MQKDATREQAQAINSFYESNRRMPTYSEMLGLFGLKSKNAAHKRVSALLKRGLLEKDDKGRLVPRAVSKPVRILGVVAAGFPSPAEEELRDVLSLEEYLISNPGATYILKVDGDSMSGAGIHPGDLVLIQKNLTPKNGDIVVARVDGEWTMKYFEKRQGRTRLKAANKKYPDIIPKNELTIAGVVIANVRKYR